MATRRELYDENHLRFAVLLFDRNGTHSPRRVIPPFQNSPFRRAKIHPPSAA
jgi:hypothetical protein